MADGYLEKHHEDYEARKAAWLRKKKHLPKIGKREIERPENESL
ncbi:MAG: dehydrogenase [Prevotella sp.]|nr:dehydrogenase [Prevotella sp.]MBO7129747.1 dehydrogenase [Prevotella sp.]